MQHRVYPETWCDSSWNIPWMWHQRDTERESYSMGMEEDPWTVDVNCSRLIVLALAWACVKVLTFCSFDAHIYCEYSIPYWWLWISFGLDWKEEEIDIIVVDITAYLWDGRQSNQSIGIKSSEMRSLHMVTLDLYQIKECEIPFHKHYCMR